MKKASSNKNIGFDPDHSSIIRPRPSLRSSDVRPIEGGSVSPRRKSRQGSVYSPQLIEYRVSVLSAMVAEDGDFPVKRLFKFKMGDPINSDSPFGHFRDGCGKFVNSRIVQGFMTIVIILMAINLGLLTSSSFDDSTISALNMLDFIILCLFTAEFSLQFIYLGLQVFRNPWLVFDVVLVIASWAALGSPVKVLRSFRIFRVFALINKWKALRRLFEAIGRTFPRISSILGVMLTFYYVFCVLFVSLFRHLYDEGAFDWDYFGNLEYAFISQFQMMTTDSWHEIVRQTFAVRYTSYLLFYLWVCFTTFVILNLLIAAMMEALGEVRDEDKLEEIVEKSKAFANAAPIDELVDKQHDLVETQKELNKTIQEVLRRVPEK